jgi:drug/metabolite transporter (DMT)-like permease
MAANTGRHSVPPPHGGRAASLSAGQAVLLGLLTLCWGFNWPMMKVGVAEVPPLTFRAASLLLGVPVLGCALALLKVPFAVPRRHWPELLLLTLTNMLIWHVCIIIAVKALPSGRAAILAYTMPVFSAVIGAWLFHVSLTAHAWLGVAAAALGVLLLLWHELTGLAGSPAGVLIVLPAAATWALGTHLLRRTSICLPTLTLAFWMTLLTSIAVLVLALSLERPPLHAPPALAWFALVYNAVLIFGFAHAAWFELARSLPPVASTVSVMLIPVLGVFSGAFFLGEVLHWQDGAAVALMVLAIAAVLWPRSEA